MSARRVTLADSPFADRSGRNVTVAVIDSGVHSGHPHVGRVSEAACLLHDGEGDTIDYLGHGTAVAAAIREIAPACELIVGKIFDRVLSTNAETLALGVSWALDRGARIVNLSLGTANATRAERLRESLHAAHARGAIVVSARASNGTLWLPGSIPGAAGVIADETLERDELAVELDEDALLLFRASPYPRPIPGVPKERNLSGVSFAVANVSGFLARLLEAQPDLQTTDDIGQVLLPGIGSWESGNYKSGKGKATRE